MSLPVEIWAQIASYGADILGRLLLVVSGLNDYLHKYRMLDDNAPLMRGFITQVYDHKEGMRIAQVIRGSADRPWVPHGKTLKYTAGNEIRSHVYYRGRKHGPVTRFPNAHSAGEIIGAWENGRHVWSKRGAYIAEPRGILADGRLVAVGSLMFDDVGYLRVTQKAGRLPYVKRYALTSVVWRYGTKKLTIQKNSFELQDGSYRVSLWGGVFRARRCFGDFHIEFGYRFCAIWGQGFHRGFVVADVRRRGANIRITGRTELLSYRTTAEGFSLLYRDRGSVIHIKQARGVREFFQVREGYVNHAVKSGQLAHTFWRTEEGLGRAVIKTPGRVLFHFYRTSDEFHLRIREDALHMELRHLRNRTPADPFFRKELLSLNNRLRGRLVMEGEESFAFIDGRLCEP